MTECFPFFRHENLNIINLEWENKKFVCSVNVKLKYKLSLLEQKLIKLLDQAGKDWNTRWFFFKIKTSAIIIDLLVFFLCYRGATIVHPSAGLYGCQRTVEGCRGRWISKTCK